MSYTYPHNPLEKGGMELSSKKKWPAHRQWKKKKEESSIVSCLQIPKGIHGK
jgi:hypothetical protein